MPKLDILFPVLGQSVPQDHAYMLFAATCAVPKMRWIHDADDLGIFPIRGNAGGNGRLTLDHRSQLRIRVDSERVSAVMPLAGKSLQVGDGRVTLGVPSLRPLVPSPVLHASMVLIKIARVMDEAAVSSTESVQSAKAARPYAQAADLSADRFLQAADAQLMGLLRPDSATDTALGDGKAHSRERMTQAELSIPLVMHGPHAGKPRRRVLNIKDRKYVGYSLLVSGLTPEESNRLQESGLGGRRKMGCGLFLPAGVGS